MVDEPLHSHEEELRECEKVSALWLCPKKKEKKNEFSGLDLSIKGRRKKN